MGAHGPDQKACHSLDSIPSASHVEVSSKLHIPDCLRQGSQIGLWEKYYFMPFDINHYCSSDVGFTNITVQSTGQPGAQTEYGVPGHHTIVCPLHM